MKPYINFNLLYFIFQFHINFFKIKKKIIRIRQWMQKKINSELKIKTIWNFNHAIRKRQLLKIKFRFKISHKNLHKNRDPNFFFLTCLKNFFCKRTSTRIISNLIILILFFSLIKNWKIYFKKLNDYLWNLQRNKEMKFSSFSDTILEHFLKHGISI